MTTTRLEEVRIILIALVAMMLLGLNPINHQALAAQRKKPRPADPRATTPQPLVPATPPAPIPQVLDDLTGDYDVAAYRVDATLQPQENLLTVSSSVVFTALKQSRSVTFELNGALKVSAVRSWDGAPLQFVQDTLNELIVRIDMGQVMNPGSQYTVAIDYAGQLVTADGGPLPDRRLAYVGPEGSYLHYASRWLPFHEYGADRATINLKLTVPSNWKVAAHEAGTPVPPVTKPDGTTVYAIVETSPVLAETVAAGPYIMVPVRTNTGAGVDVYALPGSESACQKIAEESSDILDYYQSQFGGYAFGDRYVIAQIDDQSLDMLAGAGIELMSTESIKKEMDTLRRGLAHEIALQWWGQAVGLKTFDSTWLSQGLAEYSAFLYESHELAAPGVAGLLSELGEKALAYENESSIAQAPSQLNDQTPAFRSIIVAKGAYVFHMLRYTMGNDKFNALMHEYYNTKKGRNTSIAEFEKLATRFAGQDMRWFFGMWVESTGIPEFTWDYTVLRTNTGEWRVRGTLKQSIDGFRMPVDVLVTSPGGEDRVTLNFNGATSADFLASPKGGQPTLILDPDRNILRISDNIRTAVIVRRGIQEMQDGNYVEAENKLRDAIKLAPHSSWAWYNLGLLYMRQANSQKAIDAFSQALAGDLDPRWLEVWSLIYRGNAYDALGARDRAVAEYDKAIEVGTDYDGSQAAAQKYRAEPYRPTQQ